MADICSGVSSFFFIGTECENIGRETVQFCTLFVSAAAYRRMLRFHSIERWAGCEDIGM
jgi:hypothetical protein